MESVTISVVMITYGHEKFIRQAIESVLRQKTNFKIEFIIANDNSFDDTDTIIKEIISSHDRASSIVYINNNVNKGMMENFLYALESANGEYIALCEGDDYWTDEFKLQKQFDFLSVNPNISISFHNVLVYNEFDKSKTDFYSMLNRAEPDEITSLQNLLQGNYIPTVSVLFKNNRVKFPLEFRKFTVGDWPLHILNARLGDIHFLNETMAVYRIHSGGVHQNGRGWTYKRRMAEIKSELLIYKTIKKMMDVKYSDQINSKIRNLNKLILKIKIRKYILFDKKWK